MRAWLDSSTARHRSLALWGLAYLLLAVFLVPPTWLSRLTGIDVFGLHMRSRAYFAGELLLVGLVLQRYLTLESRGKGEE